MTIERKWIIMLAVAVLAILMIGAVSVMAVGNQAPCPINGFVDPAVANWKVDVTHTSTGTTRTVYTNSNGFFSIDWANVETYALGDEFKITIENRQFNAFHNGIAVEFGTVVLDGVPIPCQTVVCPACQVCETCGECDPCGEGTVPSETDWALLLAAMGVTGVGAFIVGGKIKLNKKGMEQILAAMKPGQGIKVAKGYTGAGNFKHLHKGVVGYHDPTTNHIKPEAKHEDYEFPTGE